MADKQTAAKHTPGEWSTRCAKNGSGDIGIVVSADRIVLAECFADIRLAGERADAECLANAHLIAATPKMYEALKRLLAERDDDPERYPLEPTCNECTGGLTPLASDRGLCPWHEARAAIAKAEGRTNG